MKRIIVTATALFLLVGITNAQSDSTQANHEHHFNDHQAKGGEMHKHHGDGQKDGGKGRENWAHHDGHEMMQHLHLTKEQKEQGKAIKDNYDKQLAALYDNDKLKMGEFKKKTAALIAERKAKMEALLTVEQKSKIEAFKKKRAEDRQVMAAARLERMKINLGLNENQVASIKTAQESLHTQMKALHEDESLVPEQKKEKMKALFEQHKATVKALLTPEQQSKLESSMKHREWRG